MACRYTYKGKTYEAHEFDDVLRAMSPAEAAAFMPGVGPTPAAPFVTKTDAWVALALKRVIKMAVDEGYDRVAFVTGEQNVTRYSLENQVSTIRTKWSDSQRGERKVDIVTKEPMNVIGLIVDKSGTVIGSMTNGMNGKTLDEVIGKEMAQKVMETDGDGKWSGIDLKVGGEGMKAFYDAIVPTVAKDVLRKLGGGKVEMVTINGHATGNVLMGNNQVASNVTREQYESEWGDGYRFVQMNDPSAGLRQPGFDITPAMKEAAAGGVPLFSNRQTETPEFKRWFGGSKVVDENGKPLVVYHGTTGDLSAFDLAFSGADGVAYDRPAIFATDDARVASDYALNKRNRNIADAGRAWQRYKNENPNDYGEEYERLLQAYRAAGRKEGWDLGVGANVMPLYMSIQDPLVVDGGGQRFMQVMPDAVKQAFEQGRDGLIVRNVIDHASPASEYPATVYVAFRPEQIKSATGNTGTFDPANPDIRYSNRQTETPEFRAWFRKSAVVDAEGKPVRVYHSTNTPEDFSAFNTKDRGAWFSEDAEYTIDYATRFGEEEGARTIPAYLSIQRPLLIPRDVDLSDDVYLDEALETINAANGTSFSESIFNRRDGAVDLGYEFFAEPEFIRAVKAAGFDGMRAYENGTPTWNVFSSTQVKSAFNSGAFDPTNPDIRFANRSTWDSPDASRLDDLIHAVQDKQVDLKRVTQILRSTGAKLSIRSDGYLREELYQGRVADRTRRFLDDEMRPLLDMMRAAKVDLAQLEEYLLARHAPEANAYLESINQNRPDNTDLSGMKTADAQRIVANAPPVMAQLAQRVDAIIAGTRDLLEVSGLETPDFVEGLRRSYQFYVPLHRDDDHPGGRQSVGQGFSVKGKSVKGRTGSQGRVTNILAHIIEAREATITRAEKNVVALAIYAMAKQNPNPDFWTTETPPEVPVKDERQNVFNPGTGTMEPNPNFGQVVMRADPQWASRPNVLAAKLNGVPVGVIFNERDPRAVRMVTSLKNLDVGQLDAAMRIVATGTRWQAMVNTALNPVFMMVNFIRDVQGAAINLSSTEVSGKELAAIGGIGPAIRAIWRAERGLAPKDPKMAALYDEFRRRGAKTGYRESFVDIEARAKSLQRELDGAGSNTARAVQALADFMADANDTIENGVRLSVYKVAIEQGIHPDKAASIAKNLTVNFNRKGAKTQSVGAFYAFFNAAVQGNARLIETLRGPAGKKIIAGGLAIGVLQALMLAGADDEDEEAIPEYVKRTSLTFPYKGGYVAIPMPLGPHIIVNLGRGITNMAMALADGDTQKIPGQIVSLLSTALDAMNPLGGMETPLQMMSPTLADPIVQLTTNQGFSGRPIYRERQRDDESAPGYTLGRDSTNPIYKGAAYVVHMVFSGGNPYARNPDLPAALSPQPEAIRLIPETVFGGIWREAEKVVDTTVALATGQPVEQHRIPLVSRFSGDTTSDAAVAGVFWTNLSRVRAVEREAARAKKDDADAPDRPELEMGRRASAARKAVLGMMDRRRQMEVDGEPREAIREVEKEMTDLMRDFNADVRGIRSAR